METSSDILKAAIQGIVEGLTEFLPVSSTGHLIVVGELLGLEGEGTKAFAIFIQLGAVLAVSWERRSVLRGMLDDFRKAARDLATAPRTDGTAARLTAIARRSWSHPHLRLAILLLVAFVPAAIVGLLTKDLIKEHLFSSRVVAWSLLVGGVAILIIETFPPQTRRAELSELTLRDAIGVGLFQCLALVPGVSRAAATILGGMLLGLRRPLATEVSFLLAIPTLGAASIYSLWDSRAVLAAGDIVPFATGFLVSFVVALLVVRWLLTYVRRHDFRPFALWRFAVAAAILAFGLGAAD